MTLRGLPDGCPKGCTTLRSAPVSPFRTVQTAPSGIRCWYRCPRCLWSWWTSWDIRGREDEIFQDGAA
jgi:hypothetical protein